jgi:hypothetical protein
MALNSQRREELIQAWARRAARWHFTAPAILFLEMHKPLAFLGAQVLWAAAPFLDTWVDRAEIREFGLLLEEPASVEALICRLEAMSTDQTP